MKRNLNHYRRLMTIFIGLILSAAAFSAAASPLAPDREVSEIVKKVSPSVVRVEVRDGLRRVATGVVIDKEGYVATTALISPRKEKLMVIDRKGTAYEADFLGFDPETRIAILQVKDKRLPEIALGSSEKLEPGDWICALGILPDSGITVTQGIVSSIAEDRLRLNLWTTPGMSGGPVLNEKGQMIGLLRGVYAEDSPVVFQFRDREATGTGYVYSRAEARSSGMALAVPVETVLEVFKEIKSKGRVDRGWLGVSIAEDRKGRVVITQVEESSPAELARLKEGDRILKFNGKEIKSTDQLVNEIRKTQPGKEVSLVIERDGKTQEIRVKLGAVPEEEARRELELRFPEIFRNFPKRPALPEIPEFPRLEKFSFEFGVEDYRYIGVYLEQLNPELSKYFGVPEGQGLLVARVNPGSPAEKAGLKVGDVIISADGKRTQKLEELTDLIQRKKKGEKIALEVIRDRKKVKLEVEVAEENRELWPKVEKFSEEMEEYNKQAQEKFIELEKELKEKLEVAKAVQASFWEEMEKNIRLQSELQAKKMSEALPEYFFGSIRRI